MEGLIPLVNKLHDAFSIIEGGSAPIDLPQIVVVGSQSSGKSSVLENLVGKDFLPRGSGIVTRRPLILQLIHTPRGKPSTSSQQHLQLEENSLEFDWNESAVVEEWGEFLHVPNRRFYNFAEIREEINRETDRITGRNKGVSSIPINLKVCSPHVLNLTLVDLPGITKVPVGDQPKDIELQIRRMIMQYIEKPNTIILAVSAANTDLANSDALQMARLVDPEGRRTLGVITKLDLMDKGTDAFDVLTGRVIPLQLGFVGVVNRSQKDINENKSIKAAVASESEFFNTHPKYRAIQKTCGTSFLGRRCADILVSHIRRVLPELKQKVAQMISEQSKIMETLGDTAYEANPGAMLLQIIHEFADRYTQTIDGQVAEDISLTKLYGGARINFLFNQVFMRHVMQLDPLENLTPNEIRTIMKNATGPRTALFVPEAAFDMLVRRQIARLNEPAVLCVDMVMEELEKIVNSIKFPRLERYANLREELVSASIELLQNFQAPARDMIMNMLNMELAFINTNHPHFHVDSIINQVMAKRSTAAQSETQNIHQQPQQQVPGNPSTNPFNAAPALPSKKGAVQPAPQPQQPVPTNPAPQQPVTPHKDGNIFTALFNYNSATTSQPSNSKAKGKSKAEDKYFEDFGYYPPSEPSQQQLPPSDPRMRPYVPQSLDRVPDKINGSQLPEKKEFEIELLENLLVNYFDIVRTNVLDCVPKSIMYFLVNRSKQDLQNNLIQKLYKEQSLSHLLNEAPDVVERREKCKNLLKLLHKSQMIISEVRDYNFK